MNALVKGGGSTKEELSKKLLCFGPNGVNVFQGGKTRLPNKSKKFGILFHGCDSLCCSYD
jgi:hypothetical protein